MTKRRNGFPDALRLPEMTVLERKLLHRCAHRFAIATPKKEIPFRQQRRRQEHSYRWAMASISHSTCRGSSRTATQLLAGALGKNFA